MNTPRPRFAACVLAFSLACHAAAFGQAPAATPAGAPAPTAHAALPQDEPYQRTLREYMATLTEKDFAHGVMSSIVETPTPADPEYQYRHYLLTLMGPPLVGSKRGVPAVNNPPARFVLSSIEGPAAIMRPLVYPEALMALVQWDYPGNVYRDNRALKMRCFINATINLVMLDDWLNKNPLACRADWRSYQLVIICSAYPGFKDLLPPAVQKAFQDGVKRLARRIISWGVKGEEANLDMTAPLGLWYASRVCEDPEFTREVEAYARMMFTDPRYFHPGGYWIERGGLDMGFAGQTHFFAVWTALASNWDFAREAVDKAYRLRAHLTLPEPDGTLTGPAAFNTRLGSPANSDQWNFGGRDNAALMLTDEAACWIKPIAPETLAAGPVTRATEFKRQIAENPVKSGNGSPETPYVYFPDAEIPANPWRCNMFENWQFPASVNFAHEFYRKGAYAHLEKLQKENSPFLKFPFQREETFVRDFAGAFVVAKTPALGVVLHTGPVGFQVPGESLLQHTAPLGFGGGQLSAFWTPTTGSVILTRRGGIIHGKPFDKFEEWRNWPLHAMTGCLTSGKPFSSASIQKPAVESQLKKDTGVVRVAGALPADELFQGKVLEGKWEYSRVFKIEKDRLHVESRLTSSGQDAVAELYETIPVYLRDAALQPKAVPTTIEFESGGQWSPAESTWKEKVTAVRLTRFDGAVVITFDEPRRVSLSPEEWKDTVALSFASCRNVLVDLMPGDKSGFKSGSVGYSIAGVKK